jgi:hypothetical protein
MDLKKNDKIQILLENEGNVVLTYVGSTIVKDVKFEMFKDENGEGLLFYPSELNKAVKLK